MVVGAEVGEGEGLRPEEDSPPSQVRVAGKRDDDDDDPMLIVRRKHHIGLSIPPHIRIIPSDDGLFLLSNIEKRCMLVNRNIVIFVTLRKLNKKYIEQ